MASITDLSIEQMNNALDFCHETLEIEADADRSFQEDLDLEMAVLKAQEESERWRHDTFHEGYRISDLDAAFAKLMGDRDRRGPISGFVEDGETDIVRVAIIFLTATVPTFHQAGPGWYAVTAAGYRAGPAGDH